MVSPSPLQYDSYYHIYNRGNNRENIFIQERNYYYFMNLYARYINSVAETYAYCLLRNHFHLLVRIKSEEEIIKSGGKTLMFSNKNLVASRQSIQTNKDAVRSYKPLGSDYPSQAFSHFFNAYAKSINNAYGRTGSLFQNPFGRVAITNERQFWNVIAYIHQNPQRHKFVDDFREWKWSSYDVIISDIPTNLSRKTVLEWFGGKQEYYDLHQQWIADAEARWFAEEDYD